MTMQETKNTEFKTVVDTSSKSVVKFMDETDRALKDIDAKLKSLSTDTMTLLATLAIDVGSHDIALIAANAIKLINTLMTVMKPGWVEALVNATIKWIVTESPYVSDIQELINDSLTNANKILEIKDMVVNAINGGDINIDNGIKAVGKMIKLFDSNYLIDDYKNIMNSATGLLSDISNIESDYQMTVSEIQSLLNTKITMDDLTSIFHNRLNIDDVKKYYDMNFNLRGATDSIAKHLELKLTSNDIRGLIDKYKESEPTQ